MINNYKQNRTDSEIEDDEIIVERINQNVEMLNCDVEQISYINKSASYLKEELIEMSTHNDKLDIKLSSYNDFDAIAGNVDLVTSVENKNIELGGAGRNNQIYISMWLKEMADSIDQNKQFIIFILEEPEAHLHMPLQAMTIRRILHNIKNQIIMSTHSPKVVLEFKPNSIIRLYYSEDNKTKIANNGCSNDIIDDFINFGYRNNLISGEMFFADSVLLVEGASEELLYKELSKQLHKDVEKYNISVVPVNGVGFMSYAKILNKLKIPFALRTDNDIQILNNGKYSFTGINRLVDIYNEFFAKLDNEKIEKINSKDNKELTTDEQENFNSIIATLKEHNLYLANVDLENDLADSNILDNLLASTETPSKEIFITYMQKHKATNMFLLLQKNIDISLLKDSEIYLPLSSLLGDSNSE